MSAAPDIQPFVDLTTPANCTRTLNEFDAESITKDGSRYLTRLDSYIRDATKVHDAMTHPDGGQKYALESAIKRAQKLSAEEWKRRHFLAETNRIKVIGDDLRESLAEEAAGLASLEYEHEDRAATLSEIKRVARDTVRRCLDVLELCDAD